MAGLVPAISLRMAQCAHKRDARVKPGHDGGVSQRSAAPILCGAGYAVSSSFFPPRKNRGDGAPSGAPVFPSCRAPLARNAGASRCSIAASRLRLSPVTQAPGPRFLGRGISASPSPASSSRRGHSAPGRPGLHYCNECKREFTVTRMTTMRMSERMKTWATITPAIIGLAGVLVGSAITTGTNYFLVVRKENAEAAQDKLARVGELKTAARLVANKFFVAHAAATILAD